MDSSHNSIDVFISPELSRRPFVAYCKYSQDTLIWEWRLTTPEAYDVKVWPR